MPDNNPAHFLFQRVKKIQGMF